MKKLATVMMAALFTTHLKAQVLPVKLATYQKKYDTYGYLLPGKELTDFKVPEGEMNLIMYVVFDVKEYKKLTVQKALYLQVSTVDSGTTKMMDNCTFKPLTKNGSIYKDFGLKQEIILSP